MKNTTDARTSGKKRKKVKILPYLLILPVFTGVTIFSVYPLIKTIISSFSFTTEDGRWLDWAGTTFWEITFKDDKFLQVLGNTLKYAAVCFVMLFAMGMIMSLLSVKKTKVSRAYHTLYALPIAISSVTASVAWRFLLNKDGGLINTWLGTDINWIADKRTAFWVVAIVTVWAHLGTGYLHLLAGFRNVSEELIEAAIVDGAGPIRRATKIMIPLASPQIFFVVFLSILTSMKTYTQVKFLTAGGPGGSTNTLMYMIFTHGTLYREYEYACCLALVMFLLIFLVTRIQFLTEKKFVHYQ